VLGAEVGEIGRCRGGEAGGEWRDISIVFVRFELGISLGLRVTDYTDEDQVEKGHMEGAENLRIWGRERGSALAHVS